MARKQLGAAPSGATDAATKGYVDNALASGTVTMSGKTISLGSNTVTTTLAQLNTALTNAELVQGSVNGTSTTLTLWTGTAAQYAAIGSPDSATVYIVTP